ncbi:hypothetical protein PAMP_002295 [Pampus punctatissimus]
MQMSVTLHCVYKYYSSSSDHIARLHNPGLRLAIEEKEEEEYVSEAGLPAALEEFTTIYRDAETITDVCNSTDLPELEIISLLEEQLPVYKLRADTIFGYDQDDWLHTPLVEPDCALDLTTEQIEETLKYFYGRVSTPNGPWCMMARWV